MVDGEHLVNFISELRWNVTLNIVHFATFCQRSAFWQLVFAKLKKCVFLLKPSIVLLERTWAKCVPHFPLQSENWVRYNSRIDGLMRRGSMKTRPRFKACMENSSNYGMCIPKNILIGIVSKNISKYPTLTCLLVDNISLGSPSNSWQWYRLTTDSGHEISVLNIALQITHVKIIFGWVFHVRFAMWTNFLRGKFT